MKILFLWNPVASCSTPISTREAIRLLAGTYLIPNTSMALLTVMVGVP